MVDADSMPDVSMVEDCFAKADRLLRASRGRLRRVADNESDLAVRVGGSLAGFLDGRMDEVLATHEDYGRWFVDRELRSFSLAWDQLQLLLLLGVHLNNRCLRARPDTTSSDPRVESLLELVAFALLTGNEVLDLLRNGWPAAAEARWRTLHEIEVTALVLVEAPKSVSRRYLASWATDMQRHMERRDVRLSGRDSGAASIRSEIRKRAQEVVAEHGVVMRRQYGWAAKWLRRKQVTFRDLEEKVHRRRRRPAYVSASNRIHAGRVGALSSLLDGSGSFMIGRRSEGLADVSLQTTWSLSTIIGALLDRLYRDLGDNEFRIWDEAQTELASEVDLLTRRAEVTRLLVAGRRREAEGYMPTPGAGLLRMIREASRPRGRHSEF